MQIRVAIVDDHGLIRDALSDLIRSQPGIDVVASVGNGAEAVQIAAEYRPDVLLLDIALPDTSGLDVIAQIHDASQTTRILMLSMHSEPEYAVTACARGACGLIAKSAPIEELIDAIHAVAAGNAIPFAGELTEREREVLQQIAQGATNCEIAERLQLRPKTIEAYSQQLMSKLSIHTRAGLVGYARRIGL